MKHDLLLIFIVLIHIHSLSQVNTFELNGLIHGIDSGTVRIWLPKTFDSNFNVSEDKVHFVNSKFQINGHIEYPKLTGLTFYSNKTYYSNWFFIDPGVANLDIRVQNEELLISSTSRVFIENENFKFQIDSFRATEYVLSNYIDSISNLSAKASFSHQKDSLQFLLTRVNELEDSFLLKYTMNNPRSYISLNGISDFTYRKSYSLIYDQAFELLDQDLRSTLEGKEIIARLNNYRQLQIGLHFPSMAIYDLHGKSIELNHIKLGKYTLYDFWYSTCGPCNKQIPTLKSIYSKWHDQGLEIIGIATDYQRFEKELKSVIEKHDLKWPQYWDHDFSQSNKYSIMTYPTNFLLDKNGLVIARNIDLSDLNKFLESNLK